MPIDAQQPYDPGNIFARILRGEIPCDRLYEDDYALAFSDIVPQAPVHVLVIPTGAYVSWDDFSATASTEEIAGFVRAVGAVARQLGLEAPGYRLLANVGMDGRQEVPHLQVHLFGGAPLGRMLHIRLASAGRLRHAPLHRRRRADPCAPSRPAAKGLAMLAPPVPVSGQFDGALHRFAVRVYYEDTDLSGLVYHANYLRWFERARSDLLRLLDIDQRAAADAGEGFFTVAEVTLRYAAPARLDDDVVIETEALEVGAASVRLRQRATRGETLLAEATLRIGFISPDGRPRRQPAGWREAFATLVSVKDPA
jgi:acyl-CoA thioester hydrolase